MPGADEVSGVVNNLPAVGSPMAWGTPKETPRDGDTGNGTNVDDAARKASKEAKLKEIASKADPGAFGALAELRKVEMPTEPFGKKDAFPKYHKTGPVAFIARHSVFESFTLFVIAVNACWIGYDADTNTAASIETADPLYTIGENCFCIYFTAEILIRFMAFHTKKLCLTDGWFVFDSALVTMMVFEAWVVPLFLANGGMGGGIGFLRLLRLLRLTRMARLMRSFPELLTLVMGMLAAVRSVAMTLLLLIIFNYIFAIVFTGNLGENPAYAETFGTMGMSMFNLFLAGTLLDDITTPTRAMLDQGLYMDLGFMLLYILVSSFTVLNMLIGVLCEVVSATKASEEEKAIVELVREKIEGVLNKIDTDGSGKLSREEFDTMVDGEDAAVVKEALDEIGVEAKHLLALSDSLFELDDDEVEEIMKQNPGKTEEEIRLEGRELTFADFLKTLCHMRPENDASVMDIAEVRKMMRRALRRTEIRVENFDTQISKVEQQGLPSSHVAALRALIASTKAIKSKVEVETQRAEQAEILAQQLQSQLDYFEKHDSNA